MFGPRFWASRLGVGCALVFVAVLCREEKLPVLALVSLPVVWEEVAETAAALAEMAAALARCWRMSSRESVRSPNVRAILFMRRL